MATIAVFLLPEKVGFARVKSPGFKPSYSSVQWRLMDNVSQLATEPTLLANLVREMVGDDNKYDIYLNIWPGAYNAVMFSYDKKVKGDLKRLRQSELETVFHGELSKLYTYDLMLSKGKAGIDNKCHQIIFTYPKERLHVMIEAFKQQKMNLKRIAPMDVTAVEGIVKYWDPKDDGIHVAMVLDEGCTSISFIQKGVIHAIRTIPNGFGSVLSTYEHITGLDHDTCLDMIRSNGVNVTAEGFDMPAIQDDVMRMLNRITIETVKTLHNTFGDDAVIGKVLLCGNFVNTVGLVEYLNTMLDQDCIIASPDTLKPGAASSIALDAKDLDDLFIVAATTADGTDLMTELKKNKARKIRNWSICILLTILMGALMSVTPMHISQLKQQKGEMTNLLDQPEYATVSQLINQRAAINSQKDALAEAIQNLPHGATNTAGMIKDLYKVTADYGNVLDLEVDYGRKTINIGFVTSTYNSFIYWQKYITESGRFSFVQPPEFSGTGIIFNVNATLYAADFDMTAEELAEAEAVRAEQMPEEENPFEQPTEAPTEAPTEINEEADDSKEEGVG